MNNAANVTRVALRTIALAACVVLLAGCAGRIGDTPFEPPVMKQPAPGLAWLGDPVVDRDWVAARPYRERLRALVQRGQSVATYPMAKAQCWVDVGFHQFTRNERSAFPGAALGESERLIGALERGQTPPGDTPLIAGAASLRTDLWARVGRLKDHAGFTCAAEQTACAEVELVHAGNEFNQGGWRYANSYVRMAEDRIGRAEQAAAACPVPAPVPAPKPPVVQPAPVPVPVIPTPAPPPPAITPPPPPPPPPPQARIERHAFTTDGLFAFDRGDLDGMARTKARGLDDLIAKLRTARAIESIHVIGHTDPLGSDAYNLRLSERRAQTVREYLVRGGLPAAVITAEGRGKRQLVASCEGTQPLAARIACLAPNRRVELEVRAVMP